MFDSNNGIRYYVMAVMVGGDNVLGVIVSCFVVNMFDVKTQY